MATRVWISKVKFSDETEIELENNSLTIIVGPNNVGKSASLKEMGNLLKNLNYPSNVIKEITIEKYGSVEEISKHIVDNSVSNHDGVNPMPTYAGYNYRIYEGSIESYWNNTAITGLSELFPLFVNSLNTEARLVAANPAPNISITRDPPSHPIHFLQVDDQLEEQFCNYFKVAFGIDLLIHRNAGNEVPLYVGVKPIVQQGEDRVSKSYLEKIEMLQKLHEQGDGMRSFVGVLLNSFISSYSILFIDEPEAFLHPPQAKLLGRMIGKDLPSGKQLFLSTHSGDFIKGILDSGMDNIKIIRLQRSGNINEVSELNKNEIMEIWSDPLLRHSNILEGLFYSKVIICESDSDCKFYSSILDAITEENNTLTPDVMFLHCGGKHRMPMTVKALKKLNVPISVICDFDVLNDSNPLKNIIVELDGNWEEVEKDWKIVKKQVELKKPELNTEDVKKQIFEILNSETQDIFSNTKSKEIIKILKKTSAWAYAKELGRNFIPAGDATQSAEKLFSYMKSIGLFVLEVGELECFAKSIGNHGPKWVNEVLTKDLKNDPELQGVRSFIKEILN